MALSQLHPGVKWKFRLTSLMAVIIVSIFATLVIFAVLDFAVQDPGRNASFGLISVIFIACMIFFSIVAEVFVRLDYNNWKYEFTPTNLKIERGIIVKRYSSVPYARVQNVDIRRGVFARMLGYSEVYVQTAGYSYTSQGTPVSEGNIPAVSIDEAERIRDLLMNKIQGKPSGGL